MNSFQARDDQTTTFRVGIQKEDSIDSTQVYWIPSSIPRSLHQRFTNITRDSGKFLVYIPMTQLKHYWERFQEAYTKGLLGYGLQCATMKENSRNRDRNIRVISVHTENCMDLPETARVAWQIDKVLNSTQNWHGTMRYITDTLVMALDTNGMFKEPETLFTISSNSFIEGVKFGGTAKKTLESFTATFIWKVQNGQYYKPIR